MPTIPSKEEIKMSELPSVEPTRFKKLPLLTEE